MRCTLRSTNPCVPTVQTCESCGNTIHCFTSSGSLCFVNDYIVYGVLPMSYLVIGGGGGGGGGGGYAAGGGGGGGFRTGLVTMTAGQYPITVGAGGSSARGSNSIISGIVTSTGGGCGGSGSGSGSSPGEPGGSGGVS